MGYARVKTRRVVERGVSEAMGDLLWVGGGNPVVSRCSTTGYRPAPLPGCGFVGCGVPVVSLVPSSTTGYEPSSLRDEEAGERGEAGRRDCR
jgi:hypothetical protein